MKSLVPVINVLLNKQKKLWPLFSLPGKCEEYLGGTGMSKAGPTDGLEYSVKHCSIGKETEIYTNM